MDYIDKLNSSIDMIIDQKVDDGGKQMMNLYIKAQAFLNNLLSAHKMKNGDIELPEEIVRLRDNVNSLRSKICELDDDKRKTI